MKKIFQRALSGVLSVLFVGQVLIYGDGSSQGIAHADTIAEIKESLELSGNADKLKQEYENAVDSLGEVEHFNTSEGISLYSSNTGEPSVAESCGLSISGYVGQYGTYSDLTKVKILIFDGWDLVYETTANESGFFTASADGLGTETNVKIECDGYLPRFYKGMGWGSYWIGSPDEPEMLLPGDTTWNEEQSNQWSDEQINSADAAYVESCIGAYAGDNNYNLSCDWDGDGTITQADLDNAKAYIEANDQINVSGLAWLDIDGSRVIDGGDIDLMYSFAGLSAEGDLSSLDFNGDGYIDYDDVQYFIDIINKTDIALYNLDLYPDNILDENDISLLSSQLNLRGRSENYFEYMDKDENGTIEQSDYQWFVTYGNQYAGSNPENSYKKNIKLTGNCYNPGAFSLHDANLDLNGNVLEVADCMYFTTDIPSLWSGNKGATLDLNGGELYVYNNFVFRTASPDGWSGNAGMDLLMNGGLLYIEQCFDFGQANCYDRIIMKNAMDELAVYGNWQYVTSANMEGQWTAGNIYVCGPTWQVNEASGDKAIYSSGEHVIHFYYEGGKQTILWDNPETYIDNEDGSYNTDRRFNFDYVDEETGECLGVDFPYGYSEDLYWFRPWWRPFDEPDYTLYRKGWEMGDGVHIATGNYTKTFTDLSIESPGIQSDFIRTYNSTNEEEGSFGIGWDFNIDVSKIIEPAEGWYQVVMPDGSNSTFKEENGSFKCENNRNKMRKSGSDFIVTIPDQTEYYYNSNMKLYKIVDSEGNTLTISNIISNVRTVTDATGRTYKITYNGNSEHQRVIKIEDTTAGRTVTYEYNSDFQLISATNVAGGKETYSYDSNGHMNKITNCYDETENQITYFKDGKVDYLVNASGQKQEYTYDKAKKQTGVKEYDGNSLIKSIKYDYDEKYAVNKNVVTADGQTYDVDKITYNMVDDENKYDEMSESVDIMGNTTKYDRDDNGNVTKTTNPDGTFTLANYNSKNNVTAEVDEMGYATIKAYDKDGVRLIKEAQSLNPLSQADIDTVTAKNFDPVTYLASNESSYAITSHEYYADSYVSGVIGLIKKTTDPEGNITEYDYYKSGNGKGLVSEKWVYGNGISKPANGTRYEYNAQLQVSKETSPEGAVKEYSYDKFNNKTSEKNFGEGNSALITLTEYDKLGRKTAEYAPNYSADKSKGTLYTYYPNDKVKTETDAEGNKTSYKYDAYENEISKTNPDGTVNLTEYDGLQREKATYFKSNKDAEKQILTSSTYDFVKNNSFDVYNQDGSAQSRTSSCLKTVKTTYITADKQIVNETLADFRENVIQEKTNGTVKRTCAYFSNGQLARETDAKGNTKKYEYGYLNLLTKTLTPFNQKDGNIVYSTEIKEYDKNGNNVTVKQNIQKDNSTTDTWSITENEYNALGLLTKVTLSSSKDNIKNITKYFYDNDGTKTKMYTGLSSDSDTDYLTTNYTYDNWNRLKKTTDSTGYDSGSIAYDKNGNILTSTDPNGNVTTNTYDALNRVLTADTVNSGDSSKNVSKAYTYDSMGKIVTSESNNISQNYEYDAIGRLIRETGPNVKMYTYVGVSNYIKYEYAGINNLLNFKSTKYEYDNEMRVSKVYTNDELTGEYTYDKNGNKASEVLANGVISTYTYNLDNKITAITNNKGSKTLSGYEYSYYLDGSDACKKYTENGIIEQTSYTYDGFGRLKTEAEGNGTVTRNTLSYSYDDYGNRINMESEGTENSKTVYSYNDADGYTGLLQKETETIENITNDNTINLNPVNVKQTIYTYDANGNQITKTSDGKTETNTYDGLNQLIGFTDGETEASYTYFADGLRASKTVDGQTTKHIWDANKQIIVDVVVGDNYEATCYVRGTNLLSTYHYWYGEKQNTTYYLQNAHGDVINLSDIDGKLTKTYKYDAFGVEKNIDNSDTNAFRYCGEYFDKESGTIYLRARYYDPSIGRFISRDTFTGNNNDPLSLNLYTYCHNNPILGIDPTGHFKLPNWAKVAIGAVAIGIGVAATVATGGAAAPALLGAAKIVAASTISSAAISGAIGYATGGKEGLKKGLVDGAADGFMWGGIAAGASGLAKATSALCKGSPKTYANGAAGEKELAKMYKHGESQKRFTTSLGDRVVDRFSKNIAHESKVGYRSLDKFTKKQVLKDAELISSGQIKGAEWHFFTSSVTGKGGASKPLQNLLRKSGIKYTRH